MRSTVRKWAQRMAQEWLEVPSSTIGATSRVVILAMNQAVIENFHELLTFSQEQVCIRVKDGMISILGHDLVIRSVVPEELVVEGEISQIHFSLSS